MNYPFFGKFGGVMNSNRTLYKVCFKNPADNSDGRQLALSGRFSSSWGMDSTDMEYVQMETHKRVSDFHKGKFSLLYWAMWFLVHEKISRTDYQDFLAQNHPKWQWLDFHRLFQQWCVHLIPHEPIPRVRYPESNPSIVILKVIIMSDLTSHSINLR